MLRIQESVGVRLHGERTRQGLSLRQLAGKAGLSASMLCQIEKGTANPSVESMFSISGALGVPLSFFFDAVGPVPEPVSGEPCPNGPDGSGPVLRLGDRAHIDLYGAAWLRLTPSAEPGMEFIEGRFEVGSSTGERLLVHSGREWGIVLEGELQLELDGQVYLLQPGDTVVFDSHRPHRLTNAGSQPLRVIWINFPGPDGSSVDFPPHIPVP